MKLISWNVNGLRACASKGLLEYFLTSNADIIGLQETKTATPMPEFVLPGYIADWNCGERPGYSGTLCLSKKKALSIEHGFDNHNLDKEGRLITLEYPDFFFVNAYVPNSQGGLARWYYRLEWDTALIGYLSDLQNYKPVMISGDFNVAREHVDVFPENLLNVKKPYGFLSEERDGFNALLAIGLVDVFRELHPAKRAYTWWSSRLHKRRENRGWRIDYFLISQSLMRYVSSCEIRGDVNGSDHAPVEMVIKL